MPLTAIEQSKIYHRLAAITSTSLVANTIKQALQERPVNYVALATMVKDQIKDNPPVMITILGADTVVFFKKLKLN
ncbi:hypothetical protein ACFOW1_01560 [Parasediminibacterium paludis]|uniref:Uncharacterized protein n=1 Tax=Parasediminibacterium paludis TaxID=908966 RepID=A0ABV8PTU2_9BACT